MGEGSVVAPGVPQERRNPGRFLAIRDRLDVDPAKMFVNPYLNSVLFA
jgi:hypothetical protein